MQAFQISFLAAERLKVLHGSLMPANSDDRETIELPDNKADFYTDRRAITKSELLGVIRPRVEEIFDCLRAILDRSDFEFLPGQKIVLTGGGSKLANILDFTSIFLRKTSTGCGANENSGPACLCSWTRSSSCCRSRLEFGSTAR